MEKQILVSLPNLVESNFKKSIVYVDQHDGDGAHGWILNKELDQRVGLLKEVKLLENGGIVKKCRKILVIIK